jgi:hypothetical protein
MEQDAQRPIDTTVRRRTRSEADAVMAQMAQTIDVARLQFKRLHSDVQEYQGLAKTGATVRVFGDHPQDEDPSKSRSIRTALFADVHFLLINLHEADKMLTKLKSVFPTEADLANLRNKHRPLLKTCADFRLHIEHFDANNGVEDFGTLTDQIFRFHGKTLDIGPSLEQAAECFFADIMTAWSRISDRQRKIRDLISRARAAS